MEEQEHGSKSKKLKTNSHSAKKQIIEEDLTPKGSYKGNIKNTYINKINSLITDGKSPVEEEEYRIFWIF